MEAQRLPLHLHTCSPHLRAILHENGARFQYHACDGYEWETLIIDAEFIKSVWIMSYYRLADGTEVIYTSGNWQLELAPQGEYCLLERN